MHAPHAHASSLHEEANRVLHPALVDGIAAGTALVLLFDSTLWWHFYSNALPLLPVVEQARAQRFRQAQHRETYVLAHALWRLALATLLDLDATDVPLASTPDGQPQLPGTIYATSLSHSGNHVAIAIGAVPTIGVDIEQSPPRAGLRDLAAMLCTRGEAEALELLPLAQREPALLALWTRKEALLKAFGVGLREAPASFAADPGQLIAPPPSAATAPVCRVHTLTLGPRLVGALAAPSEITRVAMHWLAPPPGCSDTT